MNDGERKFFLRRYFTFNAQTSLTNTTTYDGSSNASFNETNELNDLRLENNLNETNCNQKQQFVKRSSSLKSVNNEYELSKHKIIRQLQSQQSIELESYFKQRTTMNRVIDSDVNFIRYRNLGKSGLRVSQFGLGTWVTFGSQISDQIAEDILTAAYLNGINCFDTAEVYAAGKAELALGRILKKKKWRRSSYIVCTKIYWGGKAETEKGLSRKHIIEGVKASLERLQLEYVDIVFANKPDAHTPMEEIVRAFTHLINKDLAFYWGTSRWSSLEIMEAYSVARQFNLIPPMCAQAEYHMFQRDEVELNLPDAYNKIGIGTMSWSPLACGLLTGKYEDGIPLNSRAALKGYNWLKDKLLSEEGKKKQAKIRELKLIAEKLNCTLAQLSIAWCLKNESVHCILLGASSVDQLYENIQSLQIVPKLTFSILSEIEKILGNKPISRQVSKCENLQKT